MNKLSKINEKVAVASLMMMASVNAFANTPTANKTDYAGYSGFKNTGIKIEEQVRSAGKDGTGALSNATGIIISAGCLIAAAIGIFFFIQGLMNLKDEQKRGQGIMGIVVGGALAVAGLAYGFIGGGFGAMFAGNV